MKIAIVDKGKYSSSHLKKNLEKAGFIITKTKPQLVISYGGDGTFFIAERKYPKILKLLVKDIKVCYLCNETNRKNLLKQLKKKKFKKQQCIKLETKGLKAVNDITIRNKDQQQALRFKVKINNKPINKEFIGDGLVIATPYGSTGYFYSITRRKFKKPKIGIAFNNTRKKQLPLIIKDNSKIEITITRGAAQVTADNNPKTILMKKSSKITIKKSKEKASIIKLK